MIIGRRSKHTDKNLYIASVLFLYGLSESQIARKMTAHGLGEFTKGRVSGILNRTPFRGLDHAKRQENLDHLKQHRLDGGILGEFVFTASSKDGRGGR
jgi:hypothetical protein